MGYYIRFFDTTDEPLTLDAVESALRAQDPAFRLERIDAEFGEAVPQADLYRAGDLLGEVEINTPGDDIFEGEIEEMLELVQQSESLNRQRVETVLHAAKRTVSVRVLYQGREIDETLVAINPLWQWLFTTRAGLLQADGEGYYDAEELILEER